MVAKKLTYGQISVLALCRLAEPIALTSVTPYLPSLIRSFHIPEPHIAFYAGLCGSAYFLFNALTALPWGLASDKYGRKSMIICGLLVNAVTALVWGFSCNLGMAVVARGLAGAGNGNVGIMRTVVAEMSTGLGRERKARMFGILPQMYQFGAIIGPAFGGALANPLHRAPDDQTRRDNLLWNFPFALPNIICAVLFLGSAILAFLLFEETMVSMKDRRDRGRELAKRIGRCVRDGCSSLSGNEDDDDDDHDDDDEEEQEPLLSNGSASHHATHTEQAAFTAEEMVSHNGVNAKPDTKKTFTTQTYICLLLYSMVPISFFTYDQQVSWMLAFPRSGPDTSPTNLPFRFSRGFGMSSRHMGLFFTASAVLGLVNMQVCPMIYGKYGTLRCLRYAMVVLPIVFMVTPFCVLVESRMGSLACLFVLWWMKGVCSAFVYPCTTMLVQDSAPSHAVLGTINGYGTAVAAIGRAIGAAIAGPAFSFGVKHGYLIMSFWMMSLVSVCAPLVTLWVVEKEHVEMENED